MRSVRSRLERLESNVMNLPPRALCNYLYTLKRTGKDEEVDRILKRLPLEQIFALYPFVRQLVADEDGISLEEVERKLTLYAQELGEGHERGFAQCRSLHPLPTAEAGRAL